MFNNKNAPLFAIILALVAFALRQEKQKDALLLELDDVLQEQKERVKELKHELSQVGFVDPVPYSARVIPSRNPHAWRWAV